MNIMDENYAIEVRNLTKHYQDFSLDHISFHIPLGAVVGFVGENGAGKTTTIKALLGLVHPEEGEISVLGHAPEGKGGSWKEEIGVVFDECNFPAGMNWREIEKVLKNLYHTWDSEKFCSYMKEFQLSVDKKVQDYSRGMKMKLSIAVALSHNSRLLILDEATSGLDPVVRSEIMDIFLDFMQDESHSILISSHITSDIEKIADYIMLIHKGKLLLFQNKDDLIYKYGVVHCTASQAEEIPEEVIVGIQKGSFETCVLVRDRSLIEGRGYVIDKASVEDILLHAVKGE